MDVLRYRVQLSEGNTREMANGLQERVVRRKMSSHHGMS